MNKIEKLNKLKEQVTKLEEEIKQEKDKMQTIIINNVEYELKQHDNNKILSEIKIPKGWRLLLPSEAMMLYERGLIDNTFWFFVKQINKEEENKGNVAGFGADSGGAILGCDRNPVYRVDALGVIFCRDIKVIK